MNTQDQRHLFSAFSCILGFSSNSTTAEILASEVELYTEQIIMLNIFAKAGF